MTMKPKLKIVIVVGIFVVIFIAGIKFLILGNKPKQAVPSSTSAPTKSETLNKEFQFQLGDSKIKFVVQDVSLNNKIIVQGQEATAVAGRTFLIVTLKLTNSTNRTLTMNTKDYVRLSVNGDDNIWLAPDIHNDPVDIQAISTKFTRVGFAVNVTDKNFVLQIGEIKGDKQKIDINL